jgi:hypothetical protein
MFQGGFYKRGCQVKTLLPSQEGLVFLGIQPLPTTPPRFDRVVRMTTHFRITPGSFGLALSADKQLGGSMANQGSI